MGRGIERVTHLDLAAVTEHRVSGDDVHHTARGHDLVHTIREVEGPNLGSRAEFLTEVHLPSHETEDFMTDHDLLLGGQKVLLLDTHEAVEERFVQDVDRGELTLSSPLPLVLAVAKIWKPAAG